MGLSISTNTLNRKQYSSEGKSFQFSADWFNVEENYIPGTTSELKAPQEHQRTWVRGRITAEQYFKKGIYSSGYYLDAVFSNQPVFTNYFGTLVNATSFNPLQDSRTLLLPHFRAFNYIAGGWRNVFALRKNLDFRLEGYAFKPFGAILRGQGQVAILDTGYGQLYFAATAGLVLHSTVGPLSLSVNYYDDKKTPLGVLLHVGFLLFNKTSTE
jgi:NTE family protein